MTSVSIGGQLSRLRDVISGFAINVVDQTVLQIADANNCKDDSSWHIPSQYLPTYPRTPTVLASNLSRCQVSPKSALLALHANTDTGFYYPFHLRLAL